jgi:hypothetical protein
MSEEAETGGETAMRRGTTVFYALAVFTAAEYTIAVAEPPLGLLLLTAIALAKAWLIVNYFMHGRQLMELRRR